MTSFGPNMKARRIALGLTLRDVERITENAISNGYLSQLENGRIKNPSAQVVVMLCAAYAVSFVDALAWLEAPAKIDPPKLCGECRRPLPPLWVIDAPQKQCFAYCGDDKCDCGAADPLATPAPTVDETDRLRGDLCDQISEYLCAGGLVNPELMNHKAVRDLLIDIRDALRAEARAALSDRPQAEGERP